MGEGMIATYQTKDQEHEINVTLHPDGLYHALIDGKEHGITSKKRGTAIKRAMRLIDEQARIRTLKEIGL